MNAVQLLSQPQHVPLRPAEMQITQRVALINHREHKITYQKRLSMCTLNGQRHLLQQH
jgi:hypothetical protein